MIKAIFFDIDGTLVTKQGKVLESTKRAIEKAKGKGIICGIATGRAPIRLSQQVEALHLDAFITYNGQFVYTREKIIYAQSFSKETLNQIVTFSDTNNRRIIFGSQDELVGSSFMKMGHKKWLTKLMTPITTIFPMNGLKNRVLTSSFLRKKYKYRELLILDKLIYQCILLSGPTEIDSLTMQLPDCHLTRSNPYAVDIIPKEGSKLKGIEQFAENNHFSLEEVMVFGDSWNDLEMLESAGIGVAMGNSEKEVKKTADFVTKTNEADGIYHALKHYQIIERRKENEDGPCI